MDKMNGKYQIDSNFSLFLFFFALKLVFGNSIYTLKLLYRPINYMHPMRLLRILFRSLGQMV